MTGGFIKLDPLVSHTVAWQLFVRDDFRYSFSESLKLAFGVDIGSVHDRVSSNVPKISTGSEDPLSDLVQLFDVLQRPAQEPHLVQSFATYATLDWKLGPVRLSPGLRMEMFAFEGQLFPAAQPRMQVSVDVHPAVRLLLSSGYYVKPRAWNGRSRKR